MTAISGRDVGGTWHVLEAVLAAPPSPRAALAGNRGLGGFAKLALAPDGTWQARAELPLDVGSVHTQRRADTVAALRAVLAGGAVAARVDGGSHAERVDGGLLAERVDRGSLAGRLDGGSLAAPPSSVSPTTDVAARCEETTWACSRLDRERVAVDLGLRGLRHARVATVSATDAVRVWIELDRVRAPLDPRCERALALLLVRAAAVVRLARPVLEPRAAHAVIAFEVTHAGPVPELAELEHAFAALRVAAETTSREIRLLARDPALAIAYLRLNDHDSHGTTHPVGPIGSATTAGASAG